MHRMRNTVITAGLSLLFSSLLAGPAAATLIGPPAGGQSYPDIEGAMNGSQTYTYNSTTQTGLFQYTDTPFVLMLGTNSTDEYNIEPTGTGSRSQTLSVTLDQHGNLVNSASNTYSLVGSVTVGSQTFSGVLLQATPTAFGSQSGSSATFDLDLTVTGGALAQAFGPELYLQLHPSLNSTFDGSFNKNFTTTTDCSSVVGPFAPVPSPIPEPTTLVVFLTCGAGLAFQRRFRRIPIRELVSGRRS